MSVMAMFRQQIKVRALSRKPVTVRKVCLNPLPASWRAAEVLESARGAVDRTMSRRIHNGNGVGVVEADR
jgi:hypothetical protein